MAFYLWDQSHVYLYPEGKEPVEREFENTGKKEDEQWEDMEIQKTGTEESAFGKNEVS